MQAIVRVISYIFLITCITSPSSNAGPILHTSPRNGTDRISPLYVSPQTPSSGFELDGQTLSLPLPTDWQANSPAGTALTKKDNPKQYLATYYPGVNPPIWMIRVQNDRSLPAVPDGVFYITGWMKKTKPKPLGQGAQGSVFEGTWQRFDEPTRSDLVSKTATNCEEPAAIKISPGRGGYVAAEVIMDISSAYIVEVFAWGLENVAAFKWTDKKTYTQMSTVAFERLEATAEYMIQNYPDFANFERASFIRTIMQGVIDAMDKGYILMDLKLDNIMIENKDIQGIDAVWKIIDVDMWISAKLETVNGQMGTMDYLPPEHYNHVPWNPEKSMVFNAAITIYYSLNRRFDKPITKEMEQVDGAANYRRKKNDNDEDGDDVRWLWAALMPGLSPEKVLELLPKPYQIGGELPEWGAFWSSVLCKEEKRIDIKSMWKALKKLLPKIEELPGLPDDIAMSYFMSSHIDSPNSLMSVDAESHISVSSS